MCIGEDPDFAAACCYELLQGYVLYGLRIPGKGIGVLQNLQKLRVRVWKCHRTHTSSRYRGTGVQIHRSSGFGIQRLYPYPGYCCTGVQNSQKIQVRLCMLYITYKSCGYGYGSVTERTEIPDTVARAYRAHGSSG